MEMDVDVWIAFLQAVKALQVLHAGTHTVQVRHETPSRLAERLGMDENGFAEALGFGDDAFYSDSAVFVVAIRL